MPLMSTFAAASARGFGRGGRSSVTVDYLILGGGGGRGAGGGGDAGGGAGGLLQGSSYTLPVGTHAIVVGATGATSTNGGDSSFNGLTAIGGGAGGDAGAGADNGNSGGSGGGGGGSSGFGSSGVGGAGTVGQGYAGGNGVDTQGGGGGGGAGGVGKDAGPPFDGAGGPGVSSSITGSAVIYGAGADRTLSAAAGIVIIRYLTGTANATGGTITTSGSYTIHTFTSNGNFVVS